jgi:hypothetical protein
MSEPEEVQLAVDPRLSVKIPRRILSRNEVIELLNNTVQSAIQSAVESARINWEKESKSTIEKAQEQANMAVLEAEERAKSRETEIRLESYDAGCAAALLVCNSSEERIITNPLVKGQPGISKVMIDVLSRKTGANDPSEYTLWVIPKFNDAAMYLADLEGSLTMLLGDYAGEDVYVIAKGGVTVCLPDEEAFFGKCTISRKNGDLEGYCLGHVSATGTALILGADERLYLYTPDASLDPEWPQMQGSRAASLEVDSNGKIALTQLSDLEVNSLSDW